MAELNATYSLPRANLTGIDTAASGVTVAFTPGHEAAPDPLKSDDL
jgi:hypothetical protein